LRWHPNEIDDGVPQLTEPSQAKLDEFVNGESVYRQDVVIWYAAHFQHEIGSGEHPECHVVGPTIRPSMVP